MKGLTMNHEKDNADEADKKPILLIRHDEDDAETEEEIETFGDILRQQIAMIRRCDSVNMHDLNAVLIIAHEEGYCELECFIKYFPEIYYDMVDKVKKS